jgi:hypothetical protein
MNTNTYGCIFLQDHGRLLLVLLTAHLAADFLFQSDRDAETRGCRRLTLRDL